MQKTIVTIPSQDASFPLPGNKSEQEVRNIIGSEIPGLSTMSATRSTDDNGDTVLTFAPRTGNKGVA